LNYLPDKPVTHEEAIKILYGFLCDNTLKEGDSLKKVRQFYHNLKGMINRHSRHLAVLFETYYDLVEITMENGDVHHIPVPLFFGHGGGRSWLIRFVMHLPRAEHRRDNNFFTCPKCKKRKSWYAGICGECDDELYEKSEDELEEYFNWSDRHSEKEMIRQKLKDEIIKYISSGNKDKIYSELKVKKIEYVVAEYHLLPRHMEKLI